jgi:hypothetical protein
MYTMKLICTKKVNRSMHVSVGCRFAEGCDEESPHGPSISTRGVTQESTLKICSEKMSKAASKVGALEGAGSWI